MSKSVWYKCFNCHKIDSFKNDCPHKCDNEGFVHIVVALDEDYESAYALVMTN